MTLFWIKKYFQSKTRQVELRDRAKRKRIQRDQRRDVLRELVKDLDRTIQRKVCRMTAVDLLQVQRNGEYSCETIMKCFCARSLFVGERSNIVAEEVYDEALSAAQQVDAYRQAKEYSLEEELKHFPLLGLPFSVKDNANLTGYDSTCGTASRCFQPASQDAVVITLLKRAGAIPFVRSNVPQSLMVAESDNNVWGRSLNPWDLARTPGGSSGGEAALLAADASPAGIGTDVGGSVRGPSHNSGVIALKPCFGRISKQGFTAPRELNRNGQEAIKSVVGPMARSVSDLVLILKTWFVSVSSDPAIVPLRFDLKQYENKEKLKIGVFYSDPSFPAAPSCRRAVQEAVDVLKAAGHEIIEISLESWPSSSSSSSNPSNPEVDVTKVNDDSSTGRPNNPNKPVYSKQSSDDENEYVKVKPSLPSLTNPEPRSSSDLKSTPLSPLASTFNQPAKNFPKTRKKFPSLLAGFLLYIGIMAADGAMTTMRKGLAGEDLIQSYQTLYLISRIPNFLRPFIAGVLKLLGEKRKAALLLASRSKSALEYWETIADRTEFVNQWNEAWCSHELDVMLCPGSPLPAMCHGSFKELSPQSSYTTLYNILDYACGMIPTTVVNSAEGGGIGEYEQSRFKDSFDRLALKETMNSEGVPLGVQVAAPPYREETVLRVMKEIEDGVKFREKFEQTGLPW